MSVASLGLTAMALPAAVTITSWSQTLEAEANDSTIAGVDLHTSVSSYFPGDDAIASSEGVSDADSTLVYTAGTVGLPAALNDPVAGFDLQFEAEVNATVGSGTIDSLANASAQITFLVEVLDNEADFTFAQTGNDADLRFFVNGIPAANASNTIRLGVGSYTVLFSDGAGASTENVNQTASEQKNAQNYNLKVIEVVPVPEPSSVSLLGLVGLGILLRRRR